MLQNRGGYGVREVAHHPEAPGGTPAAKLAQIQGQNVAIEEFDPGTAESLPQLRAEKGIHLYPDVAAPLANQAPGQGAGAAPDLQDGIALFHTQAGHDLPGQGGVFQEVLSQPLVGPHGLLLHRWRRICTLNCLCCPAPACPARRSGNRASGLRAFGLAELNPVEPDGSRKGGMRIQFVASEVAPWAKTGGLGDVLGALPKTLRQLGQEVSVVLPRYRGIQAGRRRIASLTVPLGDRLRFCPVYEVTRRQVRFFFIDYPPFYDRDGLYQAGQREHPDNAERFALLSLAALELAKRSASAPDVIHCHDWHTSLIPAYLKTIYASDPFFRRTRTLLTIHNLAYQGKFPRSTQKKISLSTQRLNSGQLEQSGKLNFLKAGLVFADGINTVSRKYSREILTPEYGSGLEGVLRTRAGELTGILNGADYDQWDPETDPNLAANYSAQSPQGKQACKRDLLETYGLPGEGRRPLVGIVSRLTGQKGFDLLPHAAPKFIADGFSLVVLGTGDERYARFFRGLQQKFPDYVSVKIMYHDGLAHKVEAGADLFLMPSRYEPCGLNQIYSLKYGTVPVVRATGGLDDTIEDYRDDGGGNGFKFRNYDSEELLQTMRRALRVYRSPDRWRDLVGNCMGLDFSWEVAARSYLELYRSLIGKADRGAE